MRGKLAEVLFRGDDVYKQLRALSGGEAARLVMAKLSVLKPNILVLDEPTNHLDLEAIEAFVEGLEAYDGTILFVSHDRWFVSRLANRILEITHNGIRDFEGSYEDYLARRGDVGALAGRNAASRAQSTAPAAIRCLRLWPLSRAVASYKAWSCDSACLASR